MRLSDSAAFALVGALAFGCETTIRCPGEPLSPAAIEDVRAAQQQGFGFLPCPLLLVPTLAERTKQIRFSTAVVVLPLRNPIQLAEEIAMLDIVTRGRVEVGFGTGYQEYEFQRFGVNLAENRAMFEESLELITKLLSAESVSHQGRYWNLPETTTLPRPITKPHPQFWRATSSVPTMAWSLERGIKVITGGTASSMDRIINNWYLFQDAVEAAKVSWPQEFIINRGVYVSDSEEDAKSMLHHAVWHTRTARGLSSNSLPVNAGRAMTELTAQMAQQDDPEFLYKDWFFGTPEIVAEKIYRMTQYVGVTYLNCTFNLGQIPHHKVMRSMELFATRVMPHFRTYMPDQAQYPRKWGMTLVANSSIRSEEHTSELQSPCNLVCRLLLEK